MSKYRNNLPQLNGKLFLTDGGLETTLIFKNGMELPHFAAFPMVTDPEQSKVLKDYYVDYINIAKQNDLGFVLETPTFRSGPEWGYKLGYDLETMREINQQSIQQLIDWREEFEDATNPIVVSGCVGPRGDGYTVSTAMTADEASKFHQFQIDAFREAGADMITSFTINYVEEALGIAQACKEQNIPVVIGLTVGTDGNLPSGQSLKSAIEQIDRETESFPIYYMINCAHPSHFEDAINSGEQWINRIMAIRANASAKSHEELDNADELDAGDVHELADHYRSLKSALPNLKVVGGCCGTDHTHVHAICNAL